MVNNAQYLWFSLKSIRRIHRLVVQSAVVGSLLLSLFGFLVPPALANRSGVGSPAPLAPAAVQKENLAPLPTGQPAAEKEVCVLAAQVPGSVRQWCGLIMRHAVENDLPPLLVAAVILQESGGNPLAYSSSGAVGLMQVMPRDGLAAEFQCLNGPCFADRPTRAALENPEFNVAYGTQMLAGLIGQKRSFREGLKAYGPMDMGYRYADLVLALYERYNTAQ